MIAIIGGGASGTLTTIYLLREATGQRLRLRRYLTELLAAERPMPPAARVSRITSQVVPIRRSGRGRPLRLHPAADSRIGADAAVLTTGNLPPAPACPVP